MPIVPRVFLLLACALSLSVSLRAQAPAPPPAPLPADPKMAPLVTKLMGRMTLAEKFGQLNLLVVGFDVTGPVVSKDVDANIRRGEVGAVLNTYTPAAVRQLQELALKQSRLKIPLMFGYDVIHGHRTIFPIPLGLARVVEGVGEEPFPHAWLEHRQLLAGGVLELELAARLGDWGRKPPQSRRF